MDLFLYVWLFHFSWKQCHLDGAQEVIGFFRLELLIWTSMDDFWGEGFPVGILILCRYVEGSGGRESLSQSEFLRRKGLCS